MKWHGLPLRLTQALMFGARIFQINVAIPHSLKLDVVGVRWFTDAATLILPH
jgi:hypothetical protein